MVIIILVMFLTGLIRGAHIESSGKRDENADALYGPDGLDVQNNPEWLAGSLTGEIIPWVIPGIGMTLSGVKSLSSIGAKASQLLPKILTKGKGTSGGQQHWSLLKIHHGILNSKTMLSI